MRCAALVFKEDILFNNHHHRCCCYLRDDEDETKLFTSWAGPESVWTASEASRNNGVLGVYLCLSDEASMYEAQRADDF